MREIKLRAWLKNEKKIVRVTGIDFDDKYGDMEYEINGTYFCEMQQNIILMQYTGLKDKNGIEIYEGDIVKDDTGYIGTIEYKITEEQEAHHGYSEKYLTAGYEFGFINEVIGNIYENPALLKEEK